MYKVLSFLTNIIAHESTSFNDKTGVKRTSSGAFFFEFSLRRAVVLALVEKAWMPGKPESVKTKKERKKGEIEKQTT